VQTRRPCFCPLKGLPPGLNIKSDTLPGILPLSKERRFPSLTYEVLPELTGGVMGKTALPCSFAGTGPTPQLRFRGVTTFEKDASISPTGCLFPKYSRGLLFSPFSSLNLLPVTPAQSPPEEIVTYPLPPPVGAPSPRSS